MLFRSAYDIYNNPIPGADFIWTTDIGIIGISGLLIAPTSPGTGQVTATNGSVQYSANVTVIPGAIDHITVVPDPVIVIAGSTRVFTATAYDVYDNIIPGVDFIWTTDVGSIDASGLFTGQSTPATGIVTAANGTVSDSANVEIIIGPLDHIIVLPDPATITVGGTRTFTATAYDSFDNVIVGVDFIWATDVGSIDASGLFTAQTIPGTGTEIGRAHV